MFVVLTVIVIVTMLGVIGLSMARQDVLGSGDVLDARAAENAAYAGLNLAVARFEDDTAITRAQLSRFLADSIATSPNEWINFAPANGPFVLQATKPPAYSITGSSGVKADVRVRIVSIDVGDGTSLPSDGMKITLQSIGTGRSGEPLTTVATYRILGLDVGHELVTTSVATPRHALYLAGNMQSAGGAMEYNGDVFLSGNYAGNTGGTQTIHGRLKVGGNMTLPTGSRVEVDSNAWIAGYLTVNSGNPMRFKSSLGVGDGIETFNDSLVVDKSLTIHGGATRNPSWQSGKSMRVGGQLFVSAQQAWPQRFGQLVVKGNAFFDNGFFSGEGSRTDSFLQRLEITNTNQGIRNNETKTSLVAQTFFSHHYAGSTFSYKTSFALSGNNKTLKVLGTTRAAYTLGVGTNSCSFIFNGPYFIADQPSSTSNCSHNNGTDNLNLCKGSISGSGTQSTNSGVLTSLNPVPLSDASIGMVESDTNLSTTFSANQPDSIVITSAMVAKMHRLSTYKDSAGISSWGTGGTGRHLNTMYNYAKSNGGLFGTGVNKYLILLVDASTSITYADASDLIEGKIFLILDQPVYSGLSSDYWPPSKDASAIQILYIPRAKTVSGVTFTGNGTLEQFSILSGSFYGYVYSEKTVSTKTKFQDPTNFYGAIALTGAGSSIETQAGKLNITIDPGVFSSMSKLGVLKNPTGTSPVTQAVVATHAGLFVRQSRLQFVPLGQYR